MRKLENGTRFLTEDGVCEITGYSGDNFYRCDFYSNMYDETGEYIGTTDVADETCKYFTGNDIANYIRIYGKQ